MACDAGGDLVRSPGLFFTNTEVAIPGIDQKTQKDRRLLCMVLFGLHLFKFSQTHTSGKKVEFFMSSNCKLISCRSSPGPAKEKYLTLLIMVFISFTLDTAAMIWPKVHRCFSIQEDHVCFLGGFKPSWMIFLSNLLVPAWVTWHVPMPSHPWVPFTGVGQSFAGGMGYIFSCLFFFLDLGCGSLRGSPEFVHASDPTMAFWV